MATNEILKFGDDASNILGQSAYAADTDRTEGVSGKARSNLQNKYQRQMSAPAAGISQFVADNNSTDTNVVDTLSAVDYAALFLDALSNAPLTTQPQFDDSQKAATTEFVNMSLGNLAGDIGYGVNTAITAAEVGYIISPTAGSVTFTLPDEDTVRAGSKLYFRGNGHGAVINAHAGQTITDGISGNVSSIPLAAYDIIEFTCVTDKWNVTGGNEQLNTSSQFSGSLASNGWLPLPGGLIMQWGRTATTGLGAGTVVSFPTPFLTSNFVVVCCDGGAVGQPSVCFACGYSPVDKTKFHAYAKTIDGSEQYVAADYSWWAVGK